ncbi:cytidylyltransferase domain-containing protein [Candidatus Berkiella aquae]|uniref:Acylneuraminate cytidylyltransferase family protein n=1 Tax=Candidatus Berkiella aquae TaxID=295108 RepID=A0A0Q9YI99_9GAMM|nr:acylneuraminate cytidylyltransferase family protein [Candidatus Berkiella aquae]MCS5712332.1 acylneuraminate cytidylyltransferase family protein [Candidatus Berkiella aquae]
MSKNRLCTICARQGSKGVPNKNIRQFHGKPLIAYVIAAAHESRLFDAIAVSSDGDDILECSRIYGADYQIKRPEAMATDVAAKLPAIQHCASQVESLSGKQFDTFVDISVTSPLLLAQDIQGVVALLEKQLPINVITGTVASNSPYFSLVEQTAEGFVNLAKKPEKPFERRQDCPPCFDMNGAIYAWTAEHFFSLKDVITDRTLIYEMPAERSVDIDTELDFEFAAFLFNKRIHPSR